MAPFSIGWKISYICGIIVVNIMLQVRITMISECVVIYEENEKGIVICSKLEDYMRVSGVWVLYGIEKETQNFSCLNIGKSVDVGSEILYDISCMHFLSIRNDGTEKYVNQFEEDCGFKYKPGQTQEYLYPIIASRYHSLKFVYVHNESCLDKEKEYAMKLQPVYWRNGSPFGIKKKIDLTSRRMLMVGELFPNGGEVYSHNDLLNKIDESLGYNNSQAERLIKDCIKAGFLTQMDNQTYTR